MSGLSAHDAAMVAKFEAAQSSPQQSSSILNQTSGSASTDSQNTSQSPAKAERPDYIPEKFWDADKGAPRIEELAKSYAELEKARSKPPESGTKTDKKDAEGSEARLDMEALSAEFQENGALSEKSYKALAKLGFDKDIVDAYIEGQKALAAQRDAKGFEAAGGREAFQKMAAWAVTNLSEAEQKAFNDAVKGSVEQMVLAVQGLRARYEAANGRDPKLTMGSQTGGADEAPFASNAEMIRAMRDPRYKSDPAYRASVERRVAGMS